MFEAEALGIWFSGFSCRMGAGGAQAVDLCCARLLAWRAGVLVEWGKAHWWIRG